MKKEKIKGLVGTFVLHLILLVLLLLFVIKSPQVQEEGGEIGRASCRERV